VIAAGWQLSFVSSCSSRDELNAELKKAMKFGFLVVFDARNGLGEAAAAQFDQLHPKLLEMITCDRKALRDKDLFELLDVSQLERRILRTGEITDSFGLIWLQSDMRLPSWSTCDTSVVLQSEPAIEMCNVASSDSGQ